MPRTALLLCVFLLMPSAVLASTVVAADQAGGYSDQVLEKVVRHWNPPVDNTERKVRVRVRVDGDGKLIRCDPVASSSLAAMDKAACAAVREAGNFGTPPYGLPLDVHLTFLSSKPATSSQAPHTEVRPESPEAKYTATVTARIRPQVIVPSKLADGTYTVRAEVRVDGDGRITQSRILRRSSNADLDNAVMRALSRADKMPIPPNKGTQDVTLVLTFKKP